MNHSPEKISKNIKKERLKCGWTQAKLGKLLGISGKQISNYENEDMSKNTLPPLDILLKLCDLFECDLGYLIGEDDYSQKTKKLSIAASETGFTEEALKNIRYVMGISSIDTKFEINAKKYQRIINSFVSSSQFIKLIIELKELDDIYSKHCSYKKQYDIEFAEIKSILDKMEPEKAALISDNLDSPEELLIQYPLSDEDKSIIRRMNSQIDSEYGHNITFERDMKLQRYIIQETISFLLNELYPIDNLSF